jgi:hypothetical protein
MTKNGGFRPGQLRAALRHPPNGAHGVDASFATLSRVTAACEARPFSR